MVARYRLGEGPEKRVEKRLQRTERAAPLGNSSITRGGLRVKSADGILAQSVAGGAPAVRVTGLQVVDGVLRVSGTIEGGGVFSWSGSLDQVGSTTLRGPVAITGQSGTLTVDAETVLRALTRVLANLQVEAGGQITVGGVKLLPSSGGVVLVEAGGRIIIQGADGDTVLNNSRLTFANGARLDAFGGAGAALSAGAVSVSISPGIARLINAGKGFEMDGFYAGPRIVGMPTILSGSAGGLPAGAVWANAAGVLFRVIL